jgi:hypothetical protein
MYFEFAWKRLRDNAETLIITYTFVRSLNSVNRERTNGIPAAVIGIIQGLYPPTYIHTHTHSHIETNTQTHTHTHEHPHTHTRTRTHTQTHTHTHTRTPPHTHTHAHTHTHTREHPQRHVRTRLPVVSAGILRILDYALPSVADVCR